MAEFKYDVAFSFLTADQPIATELKRLLSPPFEAFDAFLYTEQQKELAGPGGYEKFATVFAQDARMVIVVYRDGWGERGFTEIECTAIKRRRHREGSAFLFIVVSATDTRPTLPDWISPDFVYWDLATFGVADAADTIRQRLRRIGAAPKIETAAEMAVRLRRERANQNDRAALRRMKGPETALAELANLFTALSELAAASEGTLNPPEWNNIKTAFTFSAPHTRSTLTFAAQIASIRTERDPDLCVRYWRGGVLTVPLPGIEGGGPLYTSDYQIDFDPENGSVGWRPLRSQERSILSSREVADREVKRFLRSRSG